MGLQELLKEIGLSDEQVKAIMDGMRENKIFTASEENLDTRYGKLKTDHEGVTQRLEEANLNDPPKMVHRSTNMSMKKSELT